MARKMYGTYQPSSNMWSHSIEIPTLGKKRRRKVIRGKTQAVVDRKVRDYLLELDRTGRTPGTSPTLEQWINEWLTEIAAREVRPKTLNNYASITRVHIIPQLGNVRLDRLTAEHIEEMHEGILRTRKPNGQPLSSTTALTAHRVISSALSEAHRRGKANQNVATIAKAPRRTIPKIEPLTVEEASKLIAAFGAHEQAYLWATYLLTGARRGEILGLQWDRVSDVLDLEWQLQRHTVGMTPPADYEYQSLGGGLYLTRPKSLAGVRIVPLVEPLASIMRRWKAVAPANDHNLVFATPGGRPIDPDEATRAWQNALRAAGITRRVRLHDARHTAIDLMSAAGVPDDVIREIVGHSTVAMTRAYKSKASKERLRAALEPFTQMLTKPTPSKQIEAGG